VLCHRVSPSCFSIDGTTPAAARLSTRDKIEVSEWLAPDGFSIDLAAQQVSKAEVLQWVTIGHWSVST